MSRLKKALNNGTTFAFVSGLVFFLKSLNIVEYFKKVSVCWFKKSDKRGRILRYRRAIDVFIFLKWSFVFLLWLFGLSSMVLSIIVAYFIFMNLFTYFYYHVWQPPFNNAREDVKRRFVSLFQAIAYSIFSYAYLYALPLKERFSWTSKGDLNIDAILYSVNNSFIADYSFVAPKDSFASLISSSQIVAMFIFLTIILSNSLPGDGGGEDS